MQRAQRTGLVLARSAIGLENDVRWRDLWSTDDSTLVGSLYIVRLLSVTGGYAWMLLFAQIPTLFGL